MAKLTNLDVVKKADVFPYEDKEPERYAAEMANIVTFVWKDEETQTRTPLGYALRSVFSEICRSPVSVKGEMDMWFSPSQSFTLFHHAPNQKGRTAMATKLASHFRDKKTFTLLNAWRDEAWPCYGPDGKTLLFSMERCAVGLLGLNRYGVHMTAYVRSPDSPFGIKIWVPRRAKDKSTWPSMLDNAVAGGLMTDEDPFDCIVREADEEASLPEAVVREKAKMVGTLSYIYLTEAGAGGEDGYVYPECQWVYDLELPLEEGEDAVVPTPKDGEVDEFMLLTVDEIKEHLAAGDFKPNCGLVMVDFFVRHGIVTEENEPDYDEIVARLHRKLPFPGPHQKFEKKE